MATTIPYFTHQYNFSNLDTYNYTIQNAGTHTVSAKAQDFTNLSGVSVVIKQNGTILSTSPTQSSTQNELNVSYLVNCAAGDVISFVVSSSSPSDSGPNQIKGFFSVTQSA